LVPLAKVVVSGQTFGEMALHFIERYGRGLYRVNSVVTHNLKPP
jgi:hypothetical protein